MIPLQFKNFSNVTSNFYPAQYSDFSEVHYLETGPETTSWNPFLQMNEDQLMDEENVIDPDGSMNLFSGNEYKTVRIL